VRRIIFQRTSHASHLVVPEARSFLARQDGAVRQLTDLIGDGDGDGNDNGDGDVNDNVNDNGNERMAQAVPCG